MIPRRNVTAFPRILARVVAGGPFTKSRDRLEEVIAHEWGLLGARAMSSGRAALEWLLRAIRPRVAPVAYVPAYTIEALPEIVRSCGYEVVFLDVDLDAHGVTAEVLRRAYRGPGVAIVTHYFGLPADMFAIRDVADALGIAVVEDCAHVPGGRVEGKVVGSFGLGGAFSFETRKPLNGLGGGMVVSSHSEVVELMKTMERPPTSRRRDAMKLAMAGAEWLTLRRLFFGVLAPLLYSEGGRRLLVSMYRRVHAAGRDVQYAFSDFQAALVLDQLAGLEAANAHRRTIAAVYDEGLPPEVVRPPSPPSRPHHYYMYVVRHPQAIQFGMHLRRHGVDCGIGEEVLPLCAPAEVAPGSAEMASSAVELPMHDAMTIADARRVCEVAQRYRPR